MPPQLRVHHQPNCADNQQSLATLFNSALRQSNAIKKDLATFTDAPATGTAALQGQINASLTSFSKTVDDYSRLAKQEIVEDKKEKAQSRISNFRSELADFREQFDKLKKEREEAVCGTVQRVHTMTDDVASKLRRVAQTSSRVDHIRRPHQRILTQTPLTTIKHLHSSQPTLAC